MRGGIVVCGGEKMDGVAEYRVAWLCVALWQSLEKEAETFLLGCCFRVCIE
jgi:hypothetical protein